MLKPFFARFIPALLLCVSIGAWGLSFAGVYWLNVSAGRMVSLIAARGDLGVMWSDAKIDRWVRVSRSEENPLPTLELMGGRHTAGFRSGAAKLLGDVDTKWVGVPLWLPTILFALLTYAGWRSVIFKKKKEPLRLQKAGAFIDPAEPVAHP